MEQLPSAFRITIPEGVFIKDPETSELGKRIIDNGIILIHELGFDAFTFKKLGQRIGSNESSIYRYFESKHKFLLYLSSWYWAWIEYQFVMETHAITDPKKKLNQAIVVITRAVKNDSNFTHFNIVLLHGIMIGESSKSILTRAVDQENKAGLFVAYKRVHVRLVQLIKGVNEQYPYPASLANTVLGGALQQFYLKNHLPSLTNCNTQVTPTHFFIHLINKSLH